MFSQKQGLSPGGFNNNGWGISIDIQYISGENVKAAGKKNECRLKSNLILTI